MKWKLDLSQEFNHIYLTADEITPLIHLIDNLQASNIGNNDLRFTITNTDEEGEL